MTGCALIQQIIRPVGGNYLGTESSSGIRIQGKKVIERRMLLFYINAPKSSAQHNSFVPSEMPRNYTELYRMIIM